MKIKGLVIFSIVACVSLVGCQTAMQLHEANEQLTSYYFAKSQAAGDPAMAETATASLRDLGKTTAERARTEPDPLNKISFYRIAATAAWQAGDPDVIAYSTAGSDVCKEKWSEAPRDCGMLLFIDDLAAVDETTAKFNALKAAVPTADGAIELLELYEESANSMIDNREQMADSVPATLLAEYDKRLDDVICIKIGFGAAAMVAKAGATTDVPCRLANLRLRAKNAEAELPNCSGPLPDRIKDCQ